MEWFAFTAKCGLALAFWLIFARMFYLNEARCPPQDRIADLDSMVLLSLIWPLWVAGLGMALTAYALYWLIEGSIGVITHVGCLIHAAFHIHRPQRKTLPHV